MIAGVAALAGSAWFNHANARRARNAHPPAGDFVDVDGARLHYVARGAGSPVVLLHGNGVTLQDFEASGVLDLAAAHHRVVAFDRPGFGYSSRPSGTVWSPRAQAAAVATALRRLGIERAVVVGHSWGALVALALALDHPATVAGLVLVSGYYYGTARPDVLPMVLPALPGLGDLLAHTVSPLSGALLGPAMIRASFAPAPVPATFARFPIALTRRPAQLRATAADATLMVPAALVLSRRYREITMPVVIIAGANDPVVRPGKHAERLARAIPGSTLRVIAGQGHMLHYAVPERIVAAIDEVAQAG